MHNRTRIILAIWAICGLLWPSGGCDAAATGPALAQGLAAMQRGDFVQAIQTLQQAEQDYRRAQQPEAQGRALTLLAQAYQALGQYQQALHNLQVAHALAERVGESAQMAIVLGHLGNVHIATGPAEAAERFLGRALTLARSLDHAVITAEILNNLGNFLMSQSQFAEALAAYRESGQLAAEHERPALEASAWTNAAIAARQAGDYTGSQTLLDQAAVRAQALSSVHAQVYGLLNIGLAYRDLSPHLPEDRDALWLRAAQLLRDTAQMARANRLWRAVSYAWGYLGQLYEQESRHDEALELTHRAVFAAQQVHAPESLYRWQWQTGRLQHALGDTDAAIATYRRAVGTLQNIRHELPMSYGRPPPIFRETVGAVFFELVDLLLTRRRPAGAATAPRVSQGSARHDRNAQSR